MTEISENVLISMRIAGSLLTVWNVFYAIGLVALLTASRSHLEYRLKDLNMDEQAYRLWIAVRLLVVVSTVVFLVIAILILRNLSGI